MAKRNIVITGGAGFIGSHVVRLFVNKYPEYNIINLDKLTYAGNLANLKDIEGRPNYKFVKLDICDFDAFYQLMQDEKVDGIIHLAAESHVDRSIKDPFTFARTNVMGTLSLLQAAKLYWESLPEKYEGNASIISQRMRSMVLSNSAILKVLSRLSLPLHRRANITWPMVRISSTRLRNTIPILPIRPVRQAVITSFVPTTTPMACLPSLPIAPTTMVPISSPRS